MVSERIFLVKKITPKTGTPFSGGEAVTEVKYYGAEQLIQL